MAFDYQEPTFEEGKRYLTQHNDELTQIYVEEKAVNHMLIRESYTKAYPLGSGPYVWVKCSDYLLLEVLTK